MTKTPEIFWRKKLSRAMGRPKWKTGSEASFGSYLITTDGQHLAVRGSKADGLAQFCIGLIFVIAGLVLAYVFTMRPAKFTAPDGTPLGPIGSQIARCVFGLVFCGAFSGAGCVVVVESLRLMLLFWLFDKDAGTATFGKRRCPLADIQALRLDADRMVAVDLIVELAGGERLRLVCSVLGFRHGRDRHNQQALEKTLVALEPVARQVAEWLAVPLQRG